MKQAATRAFLASAILMGVGVESSLAVTTVIRTNDYDGGATSNPAYNFVAVGGAGVAVPAQGFAGLGVGGNVFSGNIFRNDAPLASQGSGGTFTNLPLGGSISFSFLFAAIGTWDGTAAPPLGPDRFELVVNNNVVWATTLKDFPATSSNGGTLLGSANYFAEPGSFFDAAWDFTNVPGLQNVPYAGTTFDYRFRAAGAGWQGGLDESWALDNFRVTLTAPDVMAPIPEPETYALMLAGLAAVGVVARRKKKSLGTLN